ncbi:MAG TPA: hypothetical protein VFO17_07435 [Acidimicrobiia bacterium]|nr:hypothetical protein [Acidimicrobiia bacterium]
MERLRAELATAQGRTRQRVRGIASFILVILTAVSVMIAAVSWWLHDVVFDTESFMGVVEPAVRSDEFSDALGARLGEEAVTALDLENRFETRLTAIDTYISEQLVGALDLPPRVLDLLQNLDVPRFADLAGPLANAANDRIETAVQSIVASDGFETVLVGAVRRGHAGAVALVRGDTEAIPNVYVDGNEVRWNTIPVIAGLIETVIEQGLLGGEQIEMPDFSDNPVASAAITRLGEALDARLPDDLGQLTLMSATQLQTLQTYADTMDRGVWLTIILAVVLFVVTLVVSPNRRRTLLQLCVAIGIAVVLAGLAIRAITEGVQGGIEDPESRAALATIFAEVQSSARSLGWAILLITALLALLAWLGGRPEQVAKWVEAAQQATDRKAPPSAVDRFVGRHFDVLAAAVLILTLVLVWVASPNWLWGLVILAVLGALLWWGISARARYELVQETETEKTVPV